jgi:mannosyltransferase OCH1-like enzyme
MPIPRRIIQTHRSEEVLQDLRQTWRTQHPDYEYLFFNDAQCRAFMAERLPSLLPTYDVLPLAAQKADVFRYAAIHELGGIYADVDTVCCEPMHRYVDMNAEHLVACVEMNSADFTQALDRYVPFYGLPHQFLQWTFCAPPRHPALAVLLDRIRFLVASMRAEDLPALSRHMRFTLELTGPIIFTQVLNDFLSHTRTGAVSVLERLAWGSLAPEQKMPALAGHIKVKHLFDFSWHQQGMPGQGSLHSGAVLPPRP